MAISRIVAEALGRGWSIVPIGHDKRPIVAKWKPFQTKRPTRDVVSDWTGFPDRCGWAVITGMLSAVVVLDFDGEAGAAYLAEWGVSPHVRTPSGGNHVYVPHPGWHVKTFNAKSLREPAFRGVDIRGDGGYAGFNGRMDKGSYQILRSLEELVPLEQIPEALRRYAGLLEAPAPEPPPEKPAGPRLVKNKPAGNAEPRRVDTYELIDRALSMIGATGRNDAGFWLSIQLRDNGYSESETEAAVLDFQRRCPGYDTKGKRSPYTESEAKASVRSAFSQSPRAPWEQGQFQPGKSKTTNETPPPAPAEASGSGEDEDAPPPANRVGKTILSEAQFLSTHAETLLWRYDGVMWRRSSTAELYSEAARKDGRRTTGRRRGEIASYIRAKAFQPVIDWNQGIGVSEVPVENGVLDLAGMQLRPHRPEDLLDWATPYRYEPSLGCPLWLETLESLFLKPPDEESGSDADEAAAIRDEDRVRDCRERIALLQEYFGYCLMRAAPRFALIVKGVPDTGKSVLLAVLRKIVGEAFCSSVSWEDVSDPRKLAPIAGMRLNVLPEVSERGWISDRGFNALLGGDRVAIDRKFEDPEMISPQARHVMLCNELPQVRNYSGAIYKRLLMIEMPRRLPASEQDKRREEKLIPELAAITAWSIEGARRLWAADYRFTWPKSSRDLLRRYRAEENQILEFIESRCTDDPDVLCPRESFFDAFRLWAGRKDIIDREIRLMLQAAGYKLTAHSVYYKPWGKNVRCVRGITLSAGVPDPSSK